MRVRFFFLIFLLTIVFTSPAHSEPAQDLNVEWGEGFYSVSFDLHDKRREYPDHLKSGKFPEVGKEPEIKFYDEWPILVMDAKWSISTADWPKEYRDDAIDLILMFACDAGVYEHLYPDSILKSEFTTPPSFIKNILEPDYDLAEALRGGKVEYEIKAKGGFGAADYTMKTSMRIGLDKEGESIFYYDEPSYISEYLTKRQFLFSGFDAGDTMHFEIVMLSVSKPRNLFKGEATKRVKHFGKYFVDRLYERLDDAPSKEEIDKYLEHVKERVHEAAELI